MYDTADATEEAHGAQNYDNDEKPARQRGWGVAASAALVLRDAAPHHFSMLPTLPCKPLLSSIIEFLVSSGDSGGIMDSPLELVASWDVLAGRAARA